MALPQGNEWEEKWGERYFSGGRAEKWADKWGREGADVWHEKWGESYDGAGAIQGPGEGSAALLHPCVCVFGARETGRDLCRSLAVHAA